MSVNTKHYATKVASGETVRAIQVTEKNYVGLANWANGEAVVKVNKKGEESQQRVRLTVVKQIRVAAVGDYIVRLPTRLKTFAVVKKDVFEAKYREIL